MRERVSAAQGAANLKSAELAFRETRGTPTKLVGAPRGVILLSPLGLAAERRLTAAAAAIVTRVA